MKRFIVVALSLLAFSYVSSRDFDQEEPWGSEANIVIEYSEEDIQAFEKEQKMLEAQELPSDSTE